MSVRVPSTPPRASGRAAGRSRVPARGDVPARRRDGPRLERIVLLRAFGVLVVVAFLGLLVQGAIRAFGTSEQQAQRIERAVDGKAVQPPR